MPCRRGRVQLRCAVSDRIQIRNVGQSSVANSIRAWAVAANAFPASTRPSCGRRSADSTHRLPDGVGMLWPGSRKWSSGRPARVSQIRPAMHRMVVDRVHRMVIGAAVTSTTFVVARGLARCMECAVVRALVRMLVPRFLAASTAFLHGGALNVRSMVVWFRCRPVRFGGSMAAGMQRRTPMR